MGIFFFAGGFLFFFISTVNIVLAFHFLRCIIAISCGDRVIVFITYGDVLLFPVAGFRHIKKSGVFLYGS
jgi:hypothetical protein